MEEEEEAQPVRMDQGLMESKAMASPRAAGGGMEMGELEEPVALIALLVGMGPNFPRLQRTAAAVEAAVGEVAPLYVMEHPAETMAAVEEEALVLRPGRQEALGAQG
jgi:hypothetical protein